MSNELIVKDKSEVASWDESKWQRVKELFIPKGVSNVDVEIFVELAKSYGLSPFKKEIWILPFGSKANIFAGRDGFLAIAHRSGQFDGMETNYGYDKDGKLEWAETVVYNKSCSHPVKCKVYLCEYTTGRNLWLSKPHVMLQKVAESSALRRAFNISGIYCPEEMPENEDPKPLPPKTPILDQEEKAKRFSAVILGISKIATLSVLDAQEERYHTTANTFTDLENNQIKKCFEAKRKEIENGTK